MSLFTLPGQFLVNSAGIPYGAAKVYFYQAGTLDAATVYQDIELATPHPQPVEATSAGILPPIYLNPASTTNYRAVLRTSAGVLVRDWDDIPASGISAGQIAQALYPITQAERNVSITPTDFSFPFGHSHRYGAVGDGTTDDTAAIQRAYSAVGAGGGGYIQFEAKTYRVSTLSFDGALNLTFKGKTGGNVGNPNPVGTFANATVIRSTATTGDAFTFEGTGYNSKRLVFEDIVLYSATTGYTVSFDNCSAIHFDRSMVVNDGIGGLGILFSKCYYVFCTGTFILKSQNQITGVSQGVTINMGDNAAYLGGLFNFVNCSIQSFQTGIAVGDPNPSAANENYANVNFIGSELLSNEVGAALQHGTQCAMFDGCYLEANTSLGAFVTLEATGVSFRNCFFNNYSAGVADVRFGDSGNSQYQEFYNCTVENCLFLAVNAIGVRVTGAAGSLVSVKNNRFILGTSGAVGINGGSVAACRVEDNNFDGFLSTNHTTGVFKVPGNTKTPTTFGVGDATPSVSNNRVFHTDSGTYTITGFDDGDAGQIITVLSLGAVTFDTTGTSLDGSSADIATASGDVTQWLCQGGTQWWLVGFVDASADNSAGA